MKIDTINGHLLEASSGMDKQVFIRYKKDRDRLQKLKLFGPSDYKGPLPYSPKYLKLTPYGESIAQGLWDHGKDGFRYPYNPLRRG